MSIIDSTDGKEIVIGVKRLVSTRKNRQVSVGDVYHLFQPLLTQCSKAIIAEVELNKYWKIKVDADEATIKLIRKLVSKIPEDEWTITVLQSS